MKNTFLVVTLLSLSGCSSLFCPEPKIVYQTKTLKVMVPVKPQQPPDFPKIVLPIYTLDKNSDNKQVTSSYFDTILILLNEVEKRDNALNAYRDFTPSNTTQSERPKK